MNKSSPSMPIRHTGIPYVKFICFYKEETKMAKMTNNNYMAQYLMMMGKLKEEGASIDANTSSDIIIKASEEKKEKPKDGKNYSPKFKNLLDQIQLSNTYDKHRSENNSDEFVENVLEKLFTTSHFKEHMFAERIDFVKALADIYFIPGGAVKIGYALKTLMIKSENIMPMNPEKYTESVVKLNEMLDNLIEYGVKNKLYEIDKEDAKIMADGHKEAAMVMEEANEKEVEKESASDKKKDKKETKKEDTDEKKKKEREAREAAREAAKQWIDFDEIKKMDCFKDDNKSFYKVANRITKLFGQDDVKKDIDGKKFAMAYYANKYEFVIQSNDNLLLFWFKPGYEVTQYTNIDQFNADWAKAHASEQQQPKRLSA